MSWTRSTGKVTELTRLDKSYWKLLFFDSAVHRVHAADLDVASTVSAACIVAAGYLVSAGICFCCYSILLLREDLSRNLELTESTPSLGEDCWE
ncbi:hypothetical protein Tco_0010423 [Tanacetum coccineum]